MSKPTITKLRGSQLPNPKHFGFKWKEAQKLLDEHSRLRDESKKAGVDQKAAREEVRRLENEHSRARAEAVRRGEGEPDTAAIDRAKEREIKFQGRSKDLTRAADMVDADLRRVVAEHRESWLPQVESQSKKALARREQILRDLSAVEAELGLYGGLAEWLDDPEKSFTTRLPAIPGRVA